LKYYFIVTPFDLSIQEGQGEGANALFSGKIIFICGRSELSGLRARHAPTATPPSAIG
jgi:hypothetical protein